MVPLTRGQPKGVRWFSRSPVLFAPLDLMAFWLVWVRVGKCGDAGRRRHAGAKTPLAVWASGACSTDREHNQAVAAPARRRVRIAAPSPPKPTNIIAHVAGSGTAEPEANVTAPLRGYPQISPPHVGEKYEPTEELPKPPLYKVPPPAG
jgi:hypothetical protein